MLYCIVFDEHIEPVLDWFAGFRRAIEAFPPVRHYYAIVLHQVLRRFGKISNSSTYGWSIAYAQLACCRWARCEFADLVLSVHTTVAQV